MPQHLFQLLDKDSDLLFCKTTLNSEMIDLSKRLDPGQFAGAGMIPLTPLGQGIGLIEKAPQYHR